jgi:exopolysaccharide biosynthesis polyprenyl glycosylphosphotransferase
LTITTESSRRGAPADAGPHPGPTSAGVPTGHEVGASARAARNRARDTMLRRLLGLADAAALCAALLISLYVFGEDDQRLTIVAALGVMLLMAKLLGLYDRDPHLIHKTTMDEVPSLFVISSLVVLLLFLSDDFFVVGNFEARQGVGTLLALFALMVVFRAGARRLWRSLSRPERCLLVGLEADERNLRNAIEFTDAAHVELVGFLDSSVTSLDDDPAPESTLDDLEIDRVIFGPGGPGGDELMVAIHELRDLGAKVSVIPDASRLAAASVESDILGGMTLLGMRRFGITRSSQVIKRIFDVAVAGSALLVLSPLLATIAVAIRLERPRGSVLYSQRRIGRNGESFQILKFRTMHEGAHERRLELSDRTTLAGGLFKLLDDPRTTRIGRRLRRHNLDELPQLLNVLRGEMSLVGPRPLVPEEDSSVPDRYRRRLSVRPGITGVWQVLGSARVPLEEMVKLDYLYLASWSLWGDVVLIVRTLPLIMRGRGM